MMHAVCVMKYTHLKFRCLKTVCNEYRYHVHCFNLCALLLDVKDRKSSVFNKKRTPANYKPNTDCLLDKTEYSKPSNNSMTDINGVRPKNVNNNVNNSHHNHNSSNNMNMGDGMNTMSNGMNNLSNGRNNVNNMNSVT